MKTRSGEALKPALNRVQKLIQDLGSIKTSAEPSTEMKTRSGEALKPVLNRVQK
jgi:hypothetical protein